MSCLKSLNNTNLMSQMDKQATFELFLDPFFIFSVIFCLNLTSILRYKFESFSYLRDKDNKDKT